MLSSSYLSQNAVSRSEKEDFIYPLPSKVFHYRFIRREREMYHTYIHSCLLPSKRVFSESDQ
jgi:hypothetical protein